MVSKKKAKKRSSRITVASKSALQCRLDNASLKLALEEIFCHYINTDAMVWTYKTRHLQISLDAAVTLEHLTKLSELLSSKDISFTAEAEVYSGCSDGCCSPEAEKSICITVMNVVYPKQ